MVSGRTVRMFFFFAVLSGCAEGGDEPDPSDGTAPVEESEIPGPIWDDGDGWSIMEEPSLTIGVLAGRDEYQFVDVVSGVRQSDGSLIIVDAAGKTVRMYSSEGAYLKTLGGPGSGPGEFEAPGQIRIVGDSVAVWDQRLFRITWFGPDGELVRVQSVDLAAISKAVDPPLYPALVEPLSDGWLLVRLLEKSAKTPARANPVETHRPRSGALTVQGDLSAIDTLMFFGDAEQTTVQAPWGPQQVPAPFGKRTWITHRRDPQTVCVGDQETPEIMCLGAERDPVVLRWSAEPPPPTEAEMEAWRNMIRRDYAPKVPEPDLERMLASVPMPPSRPPYSRILFDRVGNLWVEIGPVEGESLSAVEYLVFDLERGLLGPVRAPGIRLLEIGADYVLGVFKDEMEVEYVQLFGLKKP